MADITFIIAGESDQFVCGLWLISGGGSYKIRDIELNVPAGVNSTSGYEITVEAIGNTPIGLINTEPEGLVFTKGGRWSAETWSAKLSALPYVDGETVTATINPEGILPDNARTIKVIGDGSKFSCSLWNSGGWSTPPYKTQEIPLDLETVILIDHKTYLLFEIVEDAEVANIISVPVGWQASQNIAAWSHLKNVYVIDPLEGTFNNDGLILINAKFIGETDKVSPLNKLHVLTPEKIKELASFPMILNYDVGTPLNLSSFIINMLAIPFKLDPDLYLDETNIILSEFNTQILTPILKKDEVKIGLGEIVVSNLFNNSLDYSETKYKLLFPFIKKTINLEPDLVIGKTISSEYVLDCYTGDITINIFSDGDLVITESDKIGRNIPIRILQNVENNLSGFSGVLNDRMGVSIEVEKPVLVGGEMDNLVFSSGVIGGVSGYLEVLEIDLKSKATSSEKQNIINLLKNGVFINA